MRKPAGTAAHGLLSGAPQTDSARRPAGLSTRRVSASALPGSAMSMYPLWLSTPSLPAGGHFLPELVAGVAVVVDLHRSTLGSGARRDFARTGHPRVMAS